MNESSLVKRSAQRSIIPRQLRRVIQEIADFIANLTCALQSPGGY